MEITVLHNQSLFDIAIQHTGNVMNAFAIAMANDCSITAFLVAGSKLVIPGTIVLDKDIKGYYDAKKIQPATGTTEGTENGEELLEGISYWIINKNFVVQ